MQYTGWPDYGVPTHPSSLVKFVQQVRKEYKDSTAPMVVHCRWVWHIVDLSVSGFKIVGVAMSGCSSEWV